MKEFLKKFKEKFLIEWRKFQRIQATKRCGFDPYSVFEELRDVKKENERLINEVQELKANKIAVESLKEENDELASQVKRFTNMHNEFPVVIRKMWSGGEVVTWVKEKQYEYLVRKKD